MFFVDKWPGQSCSALLCAAVSPVPANCVTLLSLPVKIQDIIITFSCCRQYQQHLQVKAIFGSSFNANTTQKLRQCWKGVVYNRADSHTSQQLSTFPTFSSWPFDIWKHRKKKNHLDYTIDILKNLTNYFKLILYAKHIIQYYYSWHSSNI